MSSKSKFDWKQIQIYYNKFYTIKECMKRFDVKSAYSFERAKKRGDFIPRDKSSCQTKISENQEQKILELIAILYNKGLSYRDIRDKGYSLRQIYKARDLKLFKARTLSEAIKNRNLLKGPYLHSEETKKKISLRQSCNNKGGRCKWYEYKGSKLQGTWELNVAKTLDKLNIEWIKLKTNKHTIEYELKEKVRRYTPDFYLPKDNLYLEVKGFWTEESLDKMEAVIEQHPEINIVIIDQDKYNKFITESELVW